METRTSTSAKHCAYCGHAIADAADAADAPERFDERFCSDAHAEHFATGVRAARMEMAAQATPNAAAQPATPATGCALPPAGQRRWTDYAKRVACWGAPLLLLLALPLIWTGGWAAAGGSVLSVAALLACPLGMYFMMRSMANMQHPQTPPERRDDKEPPRA
jgi:hypothetical protein